MDRTYDLVIHNPLIIIHIAGIIGIEAIKVLGQFGQIVGTASLVHLRITASHHACHLGIWFPEHLRVSHSACGIYITILDKIPEVRRDIEILGVATCPEMP